MIKLFFRGKVSLYNNILKSSTGILMITLVVKILGYVEKLIMADYFGTSHQVDAYTLVLTIVLSIFFFFREIVEPVFLNVFLDCKKTDNEKVAWDIFNKVFRMIFFVTILLSVIALFYPQCFSSFFAPGFEGERLKLTNQLIRIAIPGSIFLALSTLTNITLNGLKIFVLPASGELVFKGGIIICMVLFFNKYGIIGSGIGILLGALGKLLVHLTKLFHKISFRKIRIESKYKNSIWRLSWPLLLGVSFSQISSLVDNIFASYLQEGVISALSYAKKVVDLPVVLFSYIISIVIFPYFTQMGVEKQNDRLIRLLGDTLKWIIIAYIPISIFFVIFSNPIIEIIFQRGAFNVDSTIITAKPFLVYSIGLVFFAIETILVIFYYSIADIRTPVFVGMICVVINILLTYLFIQIFSYLGVALAFVIQKIIKNLILLFLLRSKFNIASSQVLIFLRKILIPSILFGCITFIGKLLYNNISDSFLMKVLALGICFVLPFIVYMIIINYSKVIKIERIFKFIK